MGNLYGPILMVAAMFGFAVEDALIKTMAARLPPGQLALALGIGGGLAFALAVRRQGGRLLDRRALQGAALLRNVTEMLAAMCMILAVVLAPLSVVSAILQAMPLAVTLGAAVFLREPVGWRRWSAILVGFAGVMLIVRPGTAGFDSRALLPLGAVLFLSIRDIATRRVPPGITSLQVSGWGFLAVIPGGLLLLALRGEVPLAPTAREWGMLVSTVAIGVLAYMALVLSTRAGSIASTTPFRYSRLVFAMLLGMTLFGERPDALTLTGSAIVVAAGLYTLMREIRIGRR